VGLEKRRRLQKKNGIHARCFSLLLPTYRNLRIKSDEQKTIFAHELRSELRLTVGSSDIYVTCSNVVIFV